MGVRVHVCVYHWCESILGLRRRACLHVRRSPLRFVGYLIEPQRQGSLKCFPLPLFCLGKKNKNPAAHENDFQLLMYRAALYFSTHARARSCVCFYGYEYGKKAFLCVKIDNKHPTAASNFNFHIMHNWNWHIFQLFWDGASPSAGQHAAGVYAYFIPREATRQTRRKSINFSVVMPIDSCGGLLCSKWRRNCHY